MHAHDGFLEIPVRVGNGRVGWFVLDTGSYRSYVTEEGYARLVSEGAKTRKDGNLEPLEVRIVGVSLGKVALRKDADEYPLLAGGNNDGIIGLDLLRKFRIGVDVKNRQFRVWPAHVPTSKVRLDWFGKDPKRAVTSQEIWEPGLGTYSTMVDVDNIRMPMLLDTGSEESYLARELAPMLRPNVKAGKSKATFYFGVVDVDYYRVGHYDFSGLSIKAPRPIGATQSPNEPGLLGTDVMSKLRLLFDFPGKNLSIQPLKEVPKLALKRVYSGPTLQLPTSVSIRLTKKEIVRVEPACTYKAPSGYRKVARADGTFDLVPPGVATPKFRIKPRLLISPTIDGEACWADRPVNVPKGSKYTAPPGWTKVPLKNGSLDLYPPGYPRERYRPVDSETR